jgi:hypothetical protein
MADEGRFMPMPKTCTIQTPNYRGRYHQKYLTPPVTVPCEYVVEILTASGEPYINSGWVMFPPNTDVTNESIIIVEGLNAPVKSVKMEEDKRRRIIRGIKATLGHEKV